MKTKLLLFASAILMAMNLQAQAPEKFNYQGIARDNSGAPLANQALGLKISIIHNTTVDYSETHAVTTNDFGLYQIIIGDGTPVFGGMASVDWDSGNKFIKVEIDPAGGTNYTDLGTTELLSVPYALYALESGGGSGGNPTGAAGGDLSGNYPNPDIANNAITSTKIANGEVKTADLDNAAVTAAKIDPMGATNGQVLKYDGTNWAPASDDSGAAGWELGGNAAGPNDFIGTTNAEALRFEVNNEKAGIIDFETGSKTTAIGHKALMNYSGSYNTAFGSSALEGNVSGNRGTAIGYKALSNNTTGHRNTAMGYDAMWLNNTGGENTAVGMDALSVNSSGNQNTGIGFNANVSANDLNNATAIGANAEVSQDNSLVLGSINGVNGATASTKVGVGTTSPTALLQVEGNTPSVVGRFVQFAPTNIASAGDVLALDAPSSASGYQFIEANNGTNNVFVIQDNGDIETMGMLKLKDGLDDFSIRNTSGYLDFYHNNSLISWISNTGTYTTSDRRLKENIEPAASVLDRVNAINVVQYNYKKDESKEETIGYIAQELDKHFPEFVELSGGDEGNSGYYGVNYAGMSAVAIKAIQEQQKMIKNQQQLIQTQQAAIEKMQQRLTALEQQ